MELHLVLDQRVRADHDPGVAGEHVEQRAAAGPHAIEPVSSATRVPDRRAAELSRPRPARPEQRGDRPVVLLREHLGRRQQRRLPAGVHHLEHGAHRHEGLAGADLALQQPVHRVGAGQVGAMTSPTVRWPSVRVNGSRRRTRRRARRSTGGRGTAGIAAAAGRRCARATCRVNASSHFSRLRRAPQVGAVGRPVDRPDGQRPRPQVVPRAHLGGSGSSPASRVSRRRRRTGRSSTRSAWRSPGRPGSAQWRTPRRAPWSAGRRRTRPGAARTRGAPAGGGRGSWTPCRRTGRARPAAAAWRGSRRRAKNVSWSLPVPSVTMTSSRCFGPRAVRSLPRLAGDGPADHGGRGDLGEHGDVVVLPQRVERGQLAPGVVAAGVVAQQVTDRAQAEGLLERVARPSCPAAGPADRGAWSRSQHRSGRRHSGHAARAGVRACVKLRGRQAGSWGDGRDPPEYQLTEAVDVHVLVAEVIDLARGRRGDSIPGRRSPRRSRRTNVSGGGGGLAVGKPGRPGVVRHHPADVALVVDVRPSRSRSPQGSRT